jgi:hypothetical protein
MHDKGDKQQTTEAIMVSRKKTQVSSKTIDNSRDLSVVGTEKSKTAKSTKGHQTSLRNFFGTAASKTKRTVSFQENNENKTANSVCPLTPPTPVSPQTPLTPPTAQDAPLATPPSPDNVAVIFKKAKRETTTQTNPKDSSIDQSNEPPPSVSNKRQEKKALEQTYLDLGQVDFGKRTVCNTCGMLYVHGLNEDSKQHSRICMDYMKGVPFAVPQARVVATDSKGSIVEVRNVTVRLSLHSLL